MARTKVAIEAKIIYIVKAKCLDDITEYEFDDIKQAFIFSEVAAKWHAVRCPECGQKDSTNLGLSGFIASVSCAWDDCDFSMEIDLCSPE